MLLTLMQRRVSARASFSSSRVPKCALPLRLLLTPLPPTRFLLERVSCGLLTACLSLHPKAESQVPLLLKSVWLYSQEEWMSFYFLFSWHYLAGPISLVLSTDLSRVPLLSWHPITLSCGNGGFLPLELFPYIYYLVSAWWKCQEHPNFGSFPSPLTLHTCLPLPWLPTHGFLLCPLNLYYDSVRTGPPQFGSSDLHVNVVTKTVLSVVF